MLVRKMFYRWQFLAALVLPAWLFVGWGIFGPDGWPFLVLLVVCPVLSLGLLTVSLLNIARFSARQVRTLSWLDVSLLTALHATLVGVGFYGPANSWLILLAVALGLGAFWASAWQLATDASRRVAQVFAGESAFSGEQTVYPRPRRFGVGRDDAHRNRAGGDESYIVVHEATRPDA